MDAIYLYWGATVLFFLLTAFFSLSEAALREYSASRLEYRLKQAGRSGLAQIIEQDEPLIRELGVLRITVTILGASALALALFHVPPAPGLPFAGRVLELVALAFVLFVVGGHALPTAFMENFAEGFLLRMLPLVFLTTRLARPLTLPVLGVCSIARRAAGVPDEDESEEIVDAIRSAAIEGKHEAVLDDAARDMIENVIEFRDAAVQDVMTPRTDVVAVPFSATLQEAIAVAMDAGHSRIPVYEETIDQITGILYVKDLLRYWERSDRDGASLREIARKPLFVPKSKRVGDLLMELRTGVHITVVVDEYGGTAGIVTIEDIIEEIVGEIQDEYDPAEADQVRELPDGSVDVDAKMHIDEVNEMLGIEVPEDADYETIAGYLATALGKVPAVDDTYSTNQASFTVTAGDERRIHRVRIVRRSAPSQEP